MADKSAMSLMTTLVPFLLVRNSELPFTRPFSFSTTAASQLPRLELSGAAYLRGSMAPAGLPLPPPGPLPLVVEQRNFAVEVWRWRLVFGYSGLCWIFGLCNLVIRGILFCLRCSLNSSFDSATSCTSCPNFSTISR
jgi:hypothetical protein